MITSPKSGIKTQKNSGCGFVILMLMFFYAMQQFSSAPSPKTDIDRNVYGEERSPRRPAIEKISPRYIIEDEPQIGDFMGTAFLIDSDGSWLTAQHVTQNCSTAFIRESYGREYIRYIAESSEADIALAKSGKNTQSRKTPLALADIEPEYGDIGYHLGFPNGVAGLVQSSYLGVEPVIRGDGREEQDFIWAEKRRFPDDLPVLQGISGGPVLTQNGLVIGVNSAATARRGRIITAHPADMIALIRAENTGDDNPPVIAVKSWQDARKLHDQLSEQHILVPLICLQ